jgi:hypothetical protein
LLQVQLVDVAAVDSAAYPDPTAGLRSLAGRFDAPFEEVRALAERDELRRLFPHRLNGRVALALLPPEPDPWRPAVACRSSCSASRIHRIACCRSSSAAGRQSRSRWH